MKKKLAIICIISICLMQFAACFSAPEQQPEQQPERVIAPSVPRDGIYVGIVTFGPDAEDITNGNPVYLDSSGVADLHTLLNTRYQRETSIGTALFYAAHMAIANMTKAHDRLPHLDYVIMVTFTDGLDVSSTGLSLAPIYDPGNNQNLEFAGKSIHAYEDFIKHEIDNRKINGAGIHAYVAAVRGDDITNPSAFETALHSLASTGSDTNGIEYVQPPADDITGLLGMFDQIATGFLNILTETSFTMITPQYPPGTRIRMTFNGETTESQAHDAQMYLEGTVEIQNHEYVLTNISYGGGISSAILPAGQIRGVRTNYQVEYTFPRFSGFDMKVNTTADLANIERLLKQWIMDEGETQWQINTEYRPDPNTATQEIKSNALIYLVLDKSSSIRPDDVPRVQQAARTFIDMLYNANLNMHN